MHSRHRTLAALGCLVSFSAFAQSPAPQPAPKPLPAVRRAAGSFDVKVEPQPDAKAPSPLLGRMSLDKAYHGDLEASGRGQMLMAGTAVKGSAGYVAMEHVTGTLLGRKGSFTLQHSGTMAHGAFQLSVTVVPDSGTEGLAGISGKMAITITGGKHLYEFEYVLPDAP
jgi:hypothetical protein